MPEKERVSHGTRQRNKFDTIWEEMQFGREAASLPNTNGTYI